ncbi:hypothetical protein [Paraflavitalea pollutisoli]|uniref:hypothetical protein n=1 Tax=Paraflavitalea pollutisoli TaxID=3034143 RepID=UPI0023EB2DE0|nr:hypothetical protein [Paraflavitalea sp. H1-2-19X]
MSTHHPTTSKKHDKHAEQADKKVSVNDPGVTNNANPKTGTANSGYDEKNPKHPGGKQQQDPKVTNQENDITNTDKQHKWDSEANDHPDGNSKERTDPEIDSPIPDTETTEKKIPRA